MEPQCEIRKVMAASLKAVDEFALVFRSECNRVMGIDSHFASELLLREALTNAVVHGSSTNPNKCVKCVVRLDHRRLIIAVEDEGEGFNWRAMWTHQAADNACSGRGMEILRCYATRVRFNERGNATTIIRQF